MARPTDPIRVARPKDVEFCLALAQRGLVDVDALRRRIDEFSSIDEERRQRLRRFVERARG